VDTEGLDLEVLQSNDWGRYRPRIVIAEDLAATTLDLVSAGPISMFLRDQGYSPIAKTVNSLFFAADSRQVIPGAAR
jgi:hypothetical protein